MIFLTHSLEFYDANTDKAFIRCNLKSFSKVYTNYFWEKAGEQVVSR